jgi:hypothetical protein
LVTLPLGCPGLMLPRNIINEFKEEMKINFQTFVSKC